MFYNTYYSKFVSKGVYFLDTFQKWIFKVLERIFHVISSVPKGVPFDMPWNKSDVVGPLYVYTYF
ncbi:hypothetical protein CN641_00280 [Bacillus pseudomycoides]|nr:hypothetical protein CN641_00280 [Bacillus pseudomycoides]PHE92024.1 hypothetical protein COF78_17950 [Bacillus pseudomycoides]